MKQRTKANNKRKWIIGCILAVLFVLGFVILQRHEQRVEKQAAHDKVVAVQQTINTPGTVVDDSLDNVGCDTRDAGFSRFTKCSFVGHKYFKNSGQLEQDLRAIDKEIIALGYQHMGGYDPRVFTGKYSLSWSYYKPGHPSVYVSYFVPNDPYHPGYTLNTVAKRLNINGDVPLKDNEYVYGIRIVAAYNSNYSW